jgi:phage-related baseplate assembly protein
MSQFAPIDLSLLSPPDIIEPLDFEAILAALKADLLERAPDLSEALALESEPLVKLMEVAAYRESLVRARVNDAARACTLATATGADLDHLSAWWGVARATLDPAAEPPTMESDAVLRARVQTSIGAHTTAGSLGAYRWHALAADPTLLDAGVSSPNPGQVLISILAAAGAPDSEQLSAVAAALSADEVRPLCDTVTVESAVLVDYDVVATLHLATGPDSTRVEESARAAVAAYMAAQRRVGARLSRSAIIAALHSPGVLWVDLAEPAADILPQATAAPWPGTVTLTIQIESS